MSADAFRIFTRAPSLTSMHSSAMTSSSTVLLDDAARRERAKARLYVFCQAGGWGILVAIQLFFISIPRERKLTPDQLTLAIASTVMVSAMGLLLTHYSRPLLERWGWKTLGWRALGPRIAALAGVQSLLWTGVGFTYVYAICRVAWPAKAGPLAMVTLSWLNGAIMLTGWLCIYFFYHLFDRYNRLQIEQLSLAAHVKEAELRALKSQVNPHFIFNALNSLRALIDEDPARARQAVTQLANLLRYSLQSTQSETVAFEDELRVVNDYLALEQVRHEERLRVRFDIDPATLGLAVPPLLLQTLVENAVKYGISTRPEGGEIRITARCHDGQLELRVINPGELPATGSLAPSGSTGLGLKNAAERLRMFFGDRARLQLRAESESSVVAEVSIPVQMTRA